MKIYSSEILEGKHKGKCGEIVDINKDGIVVKDVYLRDSLTLYTRMGNVIVWLSVALYLAVISFDITRKILSRRR